MAHNVGLDSCRGRWSLKESAQNQSRFPSCLNRRQNLPNELAMKAFDQCSLSIGQGTNEAFSGLSGFESSVFDSDRHR